MFFANATLLEIAAPGPLDTNGDPGEPVTIWAGRARGYLKRIRRMMISGGLDVPVKRDILTILNSEGAPALEQAGGDWEAYTILVDDERTRETQRRRFTVRGMENRAAGTPVDSVRIELDREGAS